MAESTDTEPDIARATISISSYRMMSPGSEAVGLRTNQFKLDNLDDGRVSRVAEKFLISSRLHGWDSETCRQQIQRFIDEVHVDGILWHVDFGSASKDVMTETLH
jgi:N-glycosylase/DNA lyase